MWQVKKNMWQAMKEAKMAEMQAVRANNVEQKLEAQKAVVQTKLDAQKACLLAKQAKTEACAQAKMQRLQAKAEAKKAEQQLEAKAEEAPSKMTCPQSHVLTRFATQHGGYFCDVCKVKAVRGAQMLGCRSCDWDVCPSCEAGGSVPEPIQQAKETEAAAPASPEPVRAEEKHAVEPVVVPAAEAEQSQPEVKAEEDGDLVKPEEDADPDLVKFAVQLKVLADMGFTETKLNVYLLNRFDGKLPRVLNLYLNNA